MATLPATPFFKELDADALRTQYRQWRTLAFNSAQIATLPGGAGKSASGKANARQMGRIMRNVELIEAVADKRGISLTA